MPKLLLSATHLAELWLVDIPSSGYILPEALVILLSALTSLEALHLQFESPRSRPVWGTRRPPPPKRSILPALKQFTLRCTIDYSEDLVSRIHAPQLDLLSIGFFNRIDIDFPQLTQFISRILIHRRHDEASVQFGDSTTGVLFGTFRILITCKLERRLSFVVQIFNSSISSTVEDLYIGRRRSPLVWKYNANKTLWSSLLLPFITVKNLYLSKDFAPSIAATLQDIVMDRVVTKVLPSLQNIFVEELEPFKINIGQFVVARQLSGHPVVISHWDSQIDT